MAVNPPPLDLYRFVAASATTIKGYFITDGGRPVGDGLFTINVGTSALASLPTIPQEATGARLFTAGTVYIWLMRNEDGEFFSSDNTEAEAVAEAVSFADVVPINQAFSLGRVAS